MSGSIPSLLTLALLVSGVLGAYRGKKIGDLAELEHLVQGEVFAVDARTIHIRGFSYDGTAPDAFFYAGTSGKPSERGFIIPDEQGTQNVLGRYRNKDVTLTLPDGKTLKDIAWISIWCRAFSIDFGSLLIPNNVDYPRPQKIEAFKTNDHDVSSDRVVVVDAQTFLIPNFSYDGQAPDAHFWVGKGRAPDAKGNIVPDENGSEQPLKKYSRKTIVITLPGDQTVFDIDYISIWCASFNANFGMVMIPRTLNIPPSLKMLGVAPQTGYDYKSPSNPLSYDAPVSYKSKSSSPSLSISKHKQTAYKQTTTKKPSYGGWPPVTPTPYTKTWQTEKPRNRYSSKSRTSFNTTPRPVYTKATTRDYFGRSKSGRVATTPRPYKPTTRRVYTPPPTTTRRPYVQTTRKSYYRPTTSKRKYERPTTQKTYEPPTTKAPRYRQKTTSRYNFFNIPSTTRRPTFDDSREDKGKHARKNQYKTHDDSREDVDSRATNPFFRPKTDKRRPKKLFYISSDEEEEINSNERPQYRSNSNRKSESRRTFTTARPRQTPSFSYPKPAPQDDDSQEIHGAYNAHRQQKSSSKGDMESYSTFTMNVGGKRSSYSIFGK